VPHEATLVVAEFADERALTIAAERLRASGRRLDAHAPFPVGGIDDALGLRPTRMPLAILLGGIAGGAIGYLIQWWTTTVDYPLNAGAFPIHPVVAFIPVTFESVILGACLAGFFAVLAASGLPRLWHPLFEVEGFPRASDDRFFLSVEVAAAEVADARSELMACSPLRVETVERA
jgi:hypothetical protein